MKRIGQLLVTAVLTWFILSRLGVTWEQAFAPDLELPPAAPLWLSAATVLLLAGFLLSARLWGKMVGELGAPDPRWVGSCRVFLAANLGRYLPGKVWQFAGLAVLSRRMGIPATAATTAGVLGQVFALSAAGILAVPVLSRGGAGLGGSLLLPGAAVLAVCLIVGIPGLLRGVLAVVFRLMRLPSIHLPPIDSWFGPRWIVLHLLPWTFYGAAFHFLVQGLGFTGGFLDFAPPFAAAYLLGYLALFAPAGLGVREGFLIALLPPSVGTGGVAIAVLARLWMTAVEVIPAGGMAIWEIHRSSPPSDGAGGHGEQGVAKELQEARGRKEREAPGESDRHDPSI